MEESEKRRERLKAMRMEASQSEISDNNEAFQQSGYPSNPLIEPFATMPAVNVNSPAAAPRFDFYTDPMAAFSANKRKSKEDGNKTPQDHYFSTPISRVRPMMPPSSPLSGPIPDMTSPAHQFQTNYSPGQRMHEAPFPYLGSGSQRSPFGMASPFHGNHGTPPGAWNRSGNAVGYGFPSNSPRGGGFPSPGFGRGGSSSPNLGRGSGRGSSPNPNSGRGSDRWFNNSPSPSSGRGGGRKQGFRGCVSAQERPELFYSKSMTEDPWRLLKPVLWTPPVGCVDIPGNVRSWLLKSDSTKKARVSEAANEFRPQSSLAEYLAASFEEAINDAAST